MVSLQTERLLIRNFVHDDWQALQALIVAYQASDAAQYEDPWPTADDKIAEIASWFASGDDYLAVCIQESGELIGLVAMDQRGDEQQRIHNLGYIFHPGRAGRGYATEACRAAMGYLFGHLGAFGLLTGTHPDNRHSVTLLERLGLHPVGKGEWALSRAEWLALDHDAE